MKRACAARRRRPSAPSLAACCNFGMYKTGIRALEKTEGSAAWGNAFGVAHNPKFLGTRALFLTEIGSTAALLFGVNAIVDPELGAPAPAAPFLIGSVVGLLIFVTGPVSGCGMNPARDVGPRLVTLLRVRALFRAEAVAGVDYRPGPCSGPLSGRRRFRVQVRAAAREADYWTRCFDRLCSPPFFCRTPVPPVEGTSRTCIDRKGRCWECLCELDGDTRARASIFS